VGERERHRERWRCAGLFCYGNGAISLRLAMSTTLTCRRGRGGVGTVAVLLGRTCAIRAGRWDFGEELYAMWDR